MSGNSGSGLISTLPNLGEVTNGFTVGFTMNRNLPHTIVIASGRTENIAVTGGYTKQLTLASENDMVFLTIDEVGNWRITGGTAYPSIPFQPPQLVETGETVVAGRKVPYLSENAEFGGTYHGWVTQATSPVVGAPNIEIVGVVPPVPGERVGVEIKWNGGAAVARPTYVVQRGDGLEAVAKGLADSVVAIAQVKDAGFFTYAIPGSNRLNLQWLVITPGPVVLTPINSANLSVRIPYVSDATDFLVYQLGRTYGREARAGDALKAFDWTGPDSRSPALTTHWGQIAVQIMDPRISSPRCRMYFTSRVRAGSGEPVGTFYIENGGIVMYDAQPDPQEAKGGSMGPGTINLPASGGIYVDGEKVWPL